MLKELGYKSLKNSPQKLIKKMTNSSCSKRDPQQLLKEIIHKHYSKK